MFGYLLIMGKGYFLETTYNPREEAFQGKIGY